jgi:hypothetical protein
LVQHIARRLKENQLPEAFFDLLLDSGRAVGRTPPLYNKDKNKYSNFEQGGFQECADS